MAEEIAEVTVRSAEEEERRIAEKLHREAEDELQVERKKRARKLHEDVEAAEKVCGLDGMEVQERVCGLFREKETWVIVRVNDSFWLGCCFWTGAGNSREGSRSE